MMPDRRDIIGFGKLIGLLRDGKGNLIGRKYIHQYLAYLLYDDGRTERWTREDGEKYQCLRS